MATTVSLGSHFEQFVKEQLADGRYNNVSEVIRSGLRLLEDQERLRTLRLADLQALVQEGIDSGPGEPIEKVIGELQAKYRRPGGTMESKT